MPSKSLFAFLSLALIISAGLVLLGSSSQGAGEEYPIAKLPDGEGKDYIVALCTSCHTLRQIVIQRMPPDLWKLMVENMMARIGPGMDREAEIITQYLSAHFGPLEDRSQGELAGGPNAAEAGIGISHQVLFNFKPEVPEEKRQAILESGRKLFEGIPQVQSAVVGKVMQEDAELPYGLFIGVKNEEDLAAYRNNPDHKKWVEEVLRPAISRSVVTDIMGRN